MHLLVLLTEPHPRQPQLSITDPQKQKKADVVEHKNAALEAGPHYSVRAGWKSTRCVQTEMEATKIKRVVERGNLQSSGKGN